MNKTILSVVIVVLIFVGVIWVARPDTKKNSASLDVGSSAMLTVEESDNYDFGTISMAAGRVKHRFKLRNTSNEAVAINKIYTSCMCTTALLIMADKKFGPYGMPGHGFIPRVNQTINPNEEVVIEVTFDPAAHGPAGVGRIQRVVTVENNTGRPVELLFSAMVTP